MSKAQREIARKLRILQHAAKTGHVAKTCRYFGVGRCPHGLRLAQGRF